jgi:hypothetical protein
MRPVQLLLWVTAVLLAAELVTYVAVHVFWHKPHVTVTSGGSASLEDTLRLADTVDHSIGQLSSAMNVALPQYPASLRRTDTRNTVKNSKIPVVPALGAFGGGPTVKATQTAAANPPTAAFTLRDAVARNQKQEFRNEARFPGVLDNPATVVIVVMMHTRVAALTALLASLRRVRGIGAAVLVLSQDVELPEITALVEAIDYCIVLRVFLPAAPALFPASFPGSDPRDCPARASRAQVQELNCINKVCAWSKGWTQVHLFSNLVIFFGWCCRAGYARLVRELP